MCIRDRSKDVLLYDRYKEFADKLIAEADVICCLDFNAIHRIAVSYTHLDVYKRQVGSH